MMKRDANGSVCEWEELGLVMTCLIGCVDDPGEFCDEGEGEGENVETRFASEPRHDAHRHDVKAVR